MTQLDLFPQKAKTFSIPQREPYKSLTVCPQCQETRIGRYQFWWTPKIGYRCEDCFWTAQEAGKP